MLFQDHSLASIVEKSRLRSLPFFLGMAVAQPLESPKADDARNSEGMPFTLVELPSYKLLP